MNTIGKNRQKSPNALGGIKKNQIKLKARRIKKEQPKEVNQANGAVREMKSPEVIEQHFNDAEISEINSSTSNTGTTSPLSSISSIQTDISSSRISPSSIDEENMTYTIAFDKEDAIVPNVEVTGIITRSVTKSGSKKTNPWVQTLSDSDLIRNIFEDFINASDSKQLEKTKAGTDRLTTQEIYDHSLVLANMKHAAEVPSPSNHHVKVVPTKDLKRKRSDEGNPDISKKPRYSVRLAAKTKTLDDVAATQPINLGAYNENERNTIYILGDMSNISSYEEEDIDFSDL